MSSHIDALDQHAELLRFWLGPGGRNFTERVAAFMRQHTGDDGVMSGTADREITVLRKARTFWVDRDMSALVEHAGRTMPVETLEPEDLPAPYGFVLFEEPVIFGEVSAYNRTMTGRLPPELLRISHFTWGPVPAFAAEFGPGVNLAFYEPPATDRSRPRLPGLINQYYWQYGGVQDDENVEVTTTQAKQIAKAFWALCQQRIGEPTPGKIDRATARRAERADLPAEVATVRLRRKTPVPTENKGSNVDWKQRWVVHGFWRNQWYPKQGRHRQKWIDDYVKGPDDKPLVLKDPVYRVDR